LQTAAISTKPQADAPSNWLAALAQRGGTELTWEPRFTDFLSEAFSSEIRVHAWNNAPLAAVICEFLASCPGRPRLETGRYAIFSGAPTYGAGSRGLLWIDCANPGERTIFLAMTKYRRDMYCLDVYLNDSAPSPILPVHFLATMHLWLQSHLSGHIICVDVHNRQGYLWSLDPVQCGLEESTIKPPRKFRIDTRGAA
jgi:hypothetical protein